MQRMRSILIGFEWFRLSVCYFAITYGLLGGTTSFRDDPDYLIDVWEIEDGLPDNSATTMVQTSDGYLWFGTWRGLMRFDGVKFTLFNRKNTPQLPDDRIYRLHVDPGDRLWVSTLKGMAVREFEPGTESSVRWRTLTAEDGWIGNYAITFSERANGDFFITTADGKVMESVNGQFRTLPPPPGDPTRGYRGGIDESGHWLVMQRDWELKRELFSQWDGRQWTPKSRYDDLNVRTMTIARDGGIWLLLQDRLQKYRDGKEVKSYPLSAAIQNVWRITEDRRGNIWICTRTDGLFRVAPDGAVRQWTRDSGLLYTDVRFAFEDRESNLWVGTSGGGLARFKTRRFRQFGPEQGLPRAAIKSVWPHPDGGLWVGAYDDGLFHLTSGSATNVSFGTNQDGAANVKCVMTDRVGRTWVGTLERGLWRSDGGAFRSVPDEQIGSRRINALFEASDGRVWIGGRSSLAVCDGDTVQVYGNNTDGPATDIASLSEDWDQNLWLSNRRGVYRLDQDGFREVTHNGTNSIDRVSCMLKGENGAMWMGTDRYGLMRWRKGNLNHLGEEHGLQLAAVHEILDDDHGFYWLTSDRGIVRVNQQELASVADGNHAKVNALFFDRDDGLPGLGISAYAHPSATRDASGRLWFAMSKGVAMTDPAKFEMNRQPPSVHFEKISFRNSSPIGAPSDIDERSVTESNTDPVKLPAGSRGVNIEYTAPSFTAPEDVRFQVKLDGMDPDWRDVGNQRNAEFFELSPGDYLFRVRAANNDGVWNETGASLAFVMQPFYWQTRWFQFTVSASLAVGGGLIVMWWLSNKHRRELAELSRREREQTEMARLSRLGTMSHLAASLAHELSQPLGAILRNAEAAELFLKAPSPDLDEVKDILKDICSDERRAGDVIDRLRSMMKHREIERRPLQLEPLVSDAVSLLRTHANERNVKLSVNLSSGVESIRTEGDKVQLQQVLINLVLNAVEAVEHASTDKRELSIDAHLRDGAAEIRVKDTGPGIPEDKLESVFEPFMSSKKEGLGMGLAISRRIIESHHGKMWARNNPDVGTTFFVTLPLKETETN